MRIGDTVRVKQPTGGVRKTDRFEIIAEPEDHERGVYTVRGEIDTGFGTRRVMEGGFHHSGLEVVDEPLVDRSADQPSAPHPATLKRARAEADLKSRIEQNVEAKVMYRNGALTKEALMRTEGFVEQAIQTFRDACYAEMDDGHGLGHDGLDLAREVIENATWFPIKEREEAAYLVDEEEMVALAEAIGLKDEL